MFNFEKSAISRGACLALSLFIAFQGLLYFQIKIVLDEQFAFASMGMGYCLATCSGLLYSMEDTIREYTGRVDASYLFVGSGLGIFGYTWIVCLFTASAAQLTTFMIVAVIACVAGLYVGKKLIAFRISYFKRFGFELQK